MIHFQYIKKIFLKFTFKTGFSDIRFYFLSSCLIIHSRKLSESNAASIRDEKQANRTRIPRTLENPGTLDSIEMAM